MRGEVKDICWLVALHIKGIKGGRRDMNDSKRRGLEKMRADKSERGGRKRLDPNIDRARNHVLTMR